jgi:putative addiction module killer protein
LVQIKLAPEFDRFLKALRDPAGKAQIVRRIERLGQGNAGDWAPVGGRVNELRIHTGPGYRVYYITVGTAIIVLLYGSDKSDQQAAIVRAKEIAEQYE